MKACVTLDLESDHARRIPETAYAGWEDRRVDELLGLLGGHGVPLTVFAVAGSLGDVPGAVERFRSYGAEFHLHSFSHDLANPDSLEEIRRGADAFAAVFGHRPEGYRAPEGRISPQGLARLEAEGFLFDSSVFPSFWRRPRYMRLPREPYRPPGTTARRGPARDRDAGAARRLAQLHEAPRLALLRAAPRARRGPSAPARFSPTRPRPA